LNLELEIWVDFDATEVGANLSGKPDGGRVGQWAEVAGTPK